MAFGILNDKSSKHYLYKCLSTDTKPTTFEGKTIPGGSYCYETDTTTLYEFDGAAWVDASEYGTVNAGTQGPTGEYPATWYLEATNAAGAADNDVLYTSPDVSAYNYHVIQNNDTMNIDVHVSVDGTTFVGPAAVQTNAVTAPGTTLVTVIAASTAGVLRGKYKNIRVDQAAAGTCEAGNVLISHGVE